MLKVRKIHTRSPAKFVYIYITHGKAHHIRLKCGTRPSRACIMKNKIRRLYFPLVYNILPLLLMYDALFSCDERFGYDQNLLHHGNCLFSDQ